MLIGIDASRAIIARRTGTENYSFYLIRHLAKLVASHGNRLRLYTQATPPGGLLPSGPEVEICVIRRWRLWTHLGLGSELQRNPPDVLFVPAHVIPLRCAVPTVVTVHDLGYRYYPGAHPLMARLYLGWSTAHSTKVASRVIADSQATARDLQTFYHTPGDKIRVVYPGISSTFAPVRDPDALADVQDRYNLPNPYILHVGSLQPRKNLIRLVQAFALVRSRYRDPLDLVLAGPRGWLGEGLFAEIDRLGLESCVRLPGYVADDDLPALYTGARVFAFPSLYEGFGFPVLEAMRCELPVVCSDASSLPELVGDAAIVVPPTNVSVLADELYRVLTDDLLRQEMIARGRTRAGSFTWEACALQALAILEEVADYE